MKQATSIGAVVLAGALSRRMGSDKAAPQIGGATFLDKIVSELNDFSEVLVSVAAEAGPGQAGYRTVVDVYKDCGPLSGLYSALTACFSDALLVVTCDLPLFRRDLGEYLISQLDETCDAVVPVTAGRMHPLCAVYRKSCAAVFKDHIEHREFKMRRALDALRTKYVEIEAGDFAEMLDCNINTRADYAALGI